MNNSLILSLKEVFVSYHKNEIFKDIDLNIHRRDFIALVGKNGAGKSTLMNVISGLHEIDNGEIWHIENIAVNYFNQTPKIIDGIKSYKILNKNTARWKKIYLIFPRTKNLTASIFSHFRKKFYNRKNNKKSF